MSSFEKWGKKGIRMKLFNSLGMTRRHFLAALATLAASALAGCVPQARKETPTSSVEKPPEVSATAESAKAATATPEGQVTLYPTATKAPAKSEATVAPAASAPDQVGGIVAIAKCEEYGPERVEAVVRDLVAQCGGLGQMVKPGSTVVIKPNMTAGGRVLTLDGLPTIDTYVTHPDVTRAIALLAREAGAKRIILVEGWGLDIWEANQYGEMIKELGAEPLNLDEPAPEADFLKIPVKNHFELSWIWLHKAIAEADTFISVPKMKCHASCGITLSIKNIFGCTPLPRYRERPNEQSRTTMHAGNWGQRLPRILVDVLRARPIDFCVVDGISTIDQGEGPWNNGVAGTRIRTVRPGLLMAGRNPVAVDAVGTAVMGFDPRAKPREAPFPSGLNHIALAAEAGLGTNRLEEIEVRGVAIQDARFQFTSCPPMAADVAHMMHVAMLEAARPTI
jgi:uncharacterized protein (DUF362 family)